MVVKDLAVVLAAVVKAVATGLAVKQSQVLLRCCCRGLWEMWGVGLKVLLLLWCWCCLGVGVAGVLLRCWSQGL